MNYGARAQELKNNLISKHIEGAEGKITLKLLGVDVDVSDKSAIGNLLQEWLGQWMGANDIYKRTPDNSQVFPDFYLGEDNQKDLLEVKSFDYSKNPNFDIANFDAYIRSLRQSPYRLDADYLIFGYTLEKGKIIIDKIWLKKVWEITCPSKQYAIRTQVKQGTIVNIRPYNFKNLSRGFQPFPDRKHFIDAIHNTIAIYKGDEGYAKQWLEEVSTAYYSITSNPI